jgi:hypothetical protein
MHTDQNKELRHIQDDKDIHTDQNKRRNVQTKGKTSRNLFSAPMVFAMLMTRSHLNKSLLKLLQRQATHSL